MKKIILITAICAICTQAHSQAWNLSGNAGTNATSNFIGTTDAKAIKFRTNNNVRMTVSSSGLVGIGTASPVGKLHVKGTADATQFIIDGSATQSNINPLIKLRKNDGTDLIWIHSDDTTNCFFGLNAGKLNVASNTGYGKGNTFIGSNAGENNTDGYWNSAFGNSALSDNTTGALNTACGKNALFSNEIGNFNTAFGALALQSNTYAQYNTAIGEGALSATTIGENNTATGAGSLAYNIVGQKNAAFGAEALLSNTGSYNTATGYRSLYLNSNADYNTAYGFHSLYNNTTGTYNTANGVQSLYFNNGSSNTADGLNALYNNTSGSFNTASGKDAMFSNTTGSRNTGTGYQSLFSTTTAQYNVALGYYAARSYDNGFNNIFLGANSDVSAPGLYNVIACGQGTVVAGASTARFGNGSTVSYGGWAGWTNVSDGRFKRNIRENVPGMEFINKLRPVTYTLAATELDEYLHRNVPLDMSEEGKKYYNKALKEKELIIYTGFIAQEVEAAAKELSYDFSGLDKPKSDNDTYGLRYAEFVVPLVKAVQELDEKNSKLEMQNAELKSEVRSQKLENEKLRNDIAEIKTALGLKEKASDLRPLTSVFLEQNSPNPFTEKTVIRFNIPASSQNTELKIFSADGSELKSFNIPSKGAGQIEISGNTLAAGIYNYTLFMDGKAIDSRQMILTK